MPHIIKAIAAFERTLIDGSSDFDAYVFDGRHDALSASAKRGMSLFFSARIGCAGCHSGFNFSGNWRDRLGPTGQASFADDGLGAGRMRVPTLRNVQLTAPYMHDGRFATLDAVLDHYQHVGAMPDSAHGGQRDPRLRTFTLSSTERADLEAFLGSLTARDLASSPLAADP
jgi:cytochrome c peroxidase